MTSRGARRAAISAASKNDDRVRKRCRHRPSFTHAYGMQASGPLTLDFDDATIRILALPCQAIPSSYRAACTKRGHAQPAYILLRYYMTTCYMPPCLIRRHRLAQDTARYHAIQGKRPQLKMIEHDTGQFRPFSVGRRCLMRW